MLTTEEIDIGEAVFRVGYSSPSQFSMDYRRFFGETPSKDLRAIRLPSRLDPPRMDAHSRVSVPRFGR